jgi:metal-responsive CopG/Arc/MetJ family transcriptional regulator
MNKAKVAITLDRSLLRRVDRLIRKAVFSNRSQAIQAAVTEKLDREEHGRLARECAKLNRQEEQATAETRFTSETQWPKY